MTTTPPITKVAPKWLITGEQLEKMVFTEISFILEGILPVGLSQLVAKPKMGKSFLALDLGLSIARGEPFLSRRVEQGSVVYFALEDNHRRLQKRAKQISRTKPLPSDLHLSLLAKELQNGFEEQIIEWLAFADNPRLVVIDTLGRVMGENKPGGDDYAYATKVLGRLQRLALDNNISILVIHHANKREDVVDKFDVTLGSQGINGVMDAMFVLNRERMNHQAQLYATGRDIEEQTILMEFQSETGQWKVAAPTVMHVLGLTPERMDILKQIHRGVKKTGKIADALGKKTNAVSSLLGQLEASGYVRNTKKGEYELTDVAKDALDKAENQANVEVFDVTTHLDEGSDDSQDVVYAAPDNTILFSDTFVESPDDVEAYLDDDVIF